MSGAADHLPAFRCKKCGRIEPASHAGENDLPHACSVCGAGVTYNPRAVALAAELASPTTTLERRQEIAVEFPKILASGATEKRLDKDNWEVLADATEARLAELGVERARVVRHKGKPSGEVVTGRHVAVEANENGGVEDRAG